MKPRLARWGMVAAMSVLALLANSLGGIATAPEAIADSTSLDHISKARPVILVHGWAGTGPSMEKTKELLGKELGEGWQLLIFDYGMNNTLWAGSQEIWEPLSVYIKQVSAKQHTAGGDGLVYLVTHSMGGIAARFASVQPGVAPLIGGVATVGTPHQGSPWGNAAAGTWGKLVEVLKGRFRDPDVGTLARICLAPQSKGRGLPAECAAPPYFPAGIPVEQIAGSVVLERRYFGVHAYDITVGGDSVVPTSSANGYIGSAEGPNPRGSISPTQVDCKINEKALLSARYSLIVVPWQLLTDSSLLDQLMDDRVGSVVAVLLGRILIAGDSCSHMAMMTNSAVVRQLAGSLSTLAEKHAPMTISRLRSARIPSLCEHAAGKLKNGSLKMGEHDGYVQLDTALSQIGAIVPGQPEGAAAVFHCSQGGVGWPDYVVFFDNRGTSIGSFDSAIVGVTGGRQQVTRVAIERSSVRIEVQAVPLKGDNELWGTSRATVTYGWNAGARNMSQGRIVVSYPDPVARQFAQALNQRDLRNR